MSVGISIFVRFNLGGREAVRIRIGCGINVSPVFEVFLVGNYGNLGRSGNPIVIKGGVGHNGEMVEGKE